MTRIQQFFCTPIIAVLFLAPALSASEDSQRLWTIGIEDNNNAEFLLTPNHYGEYAEDGFFVVGQSETKRHWPYVHPGPDDAWAGGKSHTFGIAFGLKTAPQQGSCRLVFDLLDTQSAIPPKLRIDINGRTFEHATPRGGGDASVNGDPTKGREHKFEIAVPAGLLQDGNNFISITTLSGSWILYDWIGLETLPGIAMVQPSGTVVRRIRSSPLLVQREGTLQQTVSVNVLHFGDAREATIQVTNADPVHVKLKAGTSTIKVPVPTVDSPTKISVEVLFDTKILAQKSLTLQPVRKWVVYLLPHSHVDIGYTHVQTDVERSHWKYYEQAIDASRKTADYPEGAQFKWNVEVLWATDSYLQQASPEKRQEFIDAVRKGWIGLDALYGNELTALCRPEELVRLVDFGNRLKREYQVPIDSAMISDVPGYTWGIVSVLAESGVKYFSIGPNGGHRIGYTLSEYGDKPFWWRSPGGRHRLLCWIPRTGYWQGFRGEAGLLNLLKQMEDSDYSYDIVQIRHCLGDNAGPGVDLSEFVRDWNAKYAFPKLVIATTSEMMHELERRYGDQLPELSGDFTPYWEDGAASSARETALNRAAAERLVQAETMFTLTQPTDYPTDAFQQAWRNVVLYDEHTWGAHCSISQPESDFTKAQWAIKQKFALDADALSRQLLARAVAPLKPPSENVAAVDVFNTCSWPRTDLVTIPADTQLAGDLVRDANGQVVLSQRLASGNLVLLARDVPALAGKRFTFHPVRSKTADEPAHDSFATVEGFTLSNSQLTVTLDERSGSIAQLIWNGHDYASRGDAKDPRINDYYYVAGRNPENPQRAGRPTFSIKDRGPLVASMTVSSEAPGCHALEREVRVVAGLDRVDIVNTIDKRNIYEQEGVHFAFPFQVPDGVIRVDIPWAVAQVEVDQLPGACRNYLTAQRWVDVANETRGITLATVDAPLLEVGRITCDPVSVGWIKQLEPSQTLYSYVMNNYWETNYKAGQEGPTIFRYSLQPHGKYNSVVAEQFGIEQSQPLLAVPVDPQSKPTTFPLSIQGDGILATCLKRAGDGNDVIVRLFNAQAVKSHLDWHTSPAMKTQLCDLAERPMGQAPDNIEFDPWQIVTLRVTMPVR